MRGAKMFRLARSGRMSVKSVVVVLALFLAACGTSGSGGASSPKSASSSGRPLTQLSAAYASLGIPMLPMWIGVERSLFREEGLDVRMSYVEGSVAALPALTSGDI